MMKKIIELVKFQIRTYLNGSRIVMPLIVIALFLFFMYFQTQPYGVVENCAITYYFVFFIMVWIGLSMSSSEYEVVEQTIILRVNNPIRYYLSKALSLCSIGVVVILLSYFIPVIICMFNNGGMFTREITIYDLINALMLLCGSALTGASMGSFFHPRLMRDRKLAIALTALAALITFAKTGMANSLSVINIILYVFPPLDGMSRIYSGQTDVFSLGKSVGISIILLLYACLYFVVKSIMCHKRKF